MFASARLLAAMFQVDQRRACWMDVYSRAVKYLVHVLELTVPEGLVASSDSLSRVLKSPREAHSVAYEKAREDVVPVATRALWSLYKYLQRLYLPQALITSHLSVEPS